MSLREAMVSSAPELGPDHDHRTEPTAHSWSHLHSGPGWMWIISAKHELGRSKYSQGTHRELKVFVNNSWLCRGVFLLWLFFFLIGNLISFKGESSLNTKFILLADRALMSLVSCSGNR